VAQSAANTTGLISALESNGFEELAGLFSAIRLRDRDIPANLNVTVLAPTDQVTENTFCQVCGKDSPAAVITASTCPSSHDSGTLLQACAYNTGHDLYMPAMQRMHCTPEGLSTLSATPLLYCRPSRTLLPPWA
jgi:hypothetical protein